MKTAISIPGPVFQRAEAFARSRNLSRSALFTAAVDEYLQRHRDAEVTAKLDEIYRTEDSSLDPVFAQIQSASLDRKSVV